MRGPRHQTDSDFSLFVTADQIKEAMKRISAHLRENLSPRRTKDIKRAVDFLLDFPDDHRGNIVGLANKAIRWHRDCWREQAEEATRDLPDDALVAVPPIPLPQVDGIRFLSTVGDLRNESAVMQHCIRHYSKPAGDGACYLFHVEHEGDQASVEVSPFGFVAQSQGPRNSQNRATEWGRKVLGGWAKGMREMTKARNATDETANVWFCGQEDNVDQAMANEIRVTRSSPA